MSRSLTRLVVISDPDRPEEVLHAGVLAHLAGHQEGPHAGRDRHVEGGRHLPDAEHLLVVGEVPLLAEDLLGGVVQQDGDHHHLGVVFHPGVDRAVLGIADDHHHHTEDHQLHGDVAAHLQDIALRGAVGDLLLQDAKAQCPLADEALLCMFSFFS